MCFSLAGTGEAPRNSFRDTGKSWHPPWLKASQGQRTSRPVLVLAWSWARWGTIQPLKLQGCVTLFWRISAAGKPTEVADHHGLKRLRYSMLWRTKEKPCSLFSPPLRRHWSGPWRFSWVPVMGHSSKEGRYRIEERSDFPNMKGSLEIEGTGINLTIIQNSPSVDITPHEQKPPGPTRAMMTNTNLRGTFQHHQHEPSNTTRSLLPYSCVPPAFPQPKEHNLKE